MKKFYLFLIMCSIISPIYSQSESINELNFDHLTHIDSLVNKNDSLISIPVLDIVDQKLDTLIEKAIGYSNRFESRYMDMSFYKCYSDSIGIFRIVSNLPKEWIGKNNNLIGCIRKNGYVIYVFNYCHFDLNRLFIMTSESFIMNKNAKISDLVINLPTWQYLYNCKRIYPLDVPPDFK